MTSGRARVALAFLALAWGAGGLAGCGNEKPPAPRPPLPALPSQAQASATPATPTPPPPAAAGESLFCATCRQKDWGAGAGELLNTPCRECGVNLKNRWPMVYCVKCSKKLGQCMICGGPK